MSARVNVKFVVLLSVVLVAAMGGVVWAAMVVVMKSGDDHAARAMEFEAAGDFEQAENSWARAVNHDPARVDWLEGWRRSMESIDYPTASEYNQSFGQFRTVLRALADAKGTDESAYEEYLGSVLLELRNSALTRDRFEYLDDETDRILSRSDWNDPSAEARLRRHRGQFGATVLTAGADLDDDQLELITEDLELALEADPSDVDSMASLFTLKRQLAEAADRNNRDEERERFARESNRLAADFARANPESIRAQAIEIIAEVSQEFQRIGRAQLFGRDQIAAQRVVLDRYTDRVLELNERFKAAGADQTDSDTAAILMQITRQIVREQPMDLVLAIWDHAAATRPDDVDVMRQRATFLKLLQRYPEAIDAFGEIAAMERPPVSARGVLLVQAQQRVNWQIADCAIEQWRLLPPGSASRDGWLADAREAWVAASEDLPQDSPELTLLNAKLAFADKDYNSADRLIRAYNTRTLESDPTAVRLAAEIAGELNNAGEQRRLLMRAVALDRNDLRALLPLVEINTRLRNYGEAERLLAMAVDMLPDNEALRDRLDTIRALAGSTEIEDPVQAALIEAQRSIDAGDRGAAIETLERAAADNPEPDSARLQITMASLLLQAGEFERAAEIVAQGLEIEPESAMLRQLRRQAEIGDNAELAEAAIDELDLPEAARWLRKHRVRLAANDMDGATEAIDRAVEIDGDDPAVLRAAFDHALRIGDLDRGREIAEAGGRQDIDGAGGLAMQARVHIADGNLAEAERAATAAVERGSQNASTLRLLAQVQFDRGNSTAALDNFERAREIRPDDIGLLTSYLRALGTLGRNTEALEIARDAVDIARTNSGFVEAWLYFEALAGNKQLALDERSAIAQRRPEDAENTAAMISLAIDLGEFDEARRLLDDARGARDSLRLVALDARWHAERNDPNGAVEQYTSFLVSDAPEAATAAPYIAFGSFLLNRGQIDRGLTTLRQGRQFQNPENPVVDSTLGQQLFRLGRYQQAIEVFRSIIDGEAAGTPIAAESGKRLIECYTRIGDWESAQAEVDALDAETRDELVVRLLRSSIAEGLGNEAEARRLVDDAITAYPEASRPYVVRATMLLQDPALVEDAVEDLTRAIELNPADLNAYRIRSLAYVQLNRMSDAVRDVLAAVEANPDNAELRIGAASRLIDLGRQDDAADVIDAGLERQGSSLQLLVSAGQMFAELGQPRRAVQYLEPAWEQTGDPAIAARLVGSLLEFPRPDVRRARQIAGSQRLSADDYRVLLMRASVESQAENTGELERLLTEAYRLVRDQGPELQAWASQLVALLGSGEAAVDYLRRLDRSERLSPWTRFSMARILAEEDDGRAESLRVLDRLVDGTRDSAVRLAAIRFRSLVHYDLEDYQRAADDMQRVLDVTPNDPDTLNNLAYTRAVHLGEADLAVPLAERVAELRPNNRGVLDTLGVVYLRAGRAADAISPLERALGVASSDLDRASVLIHLAEARLETGNTPGAENAAQEARAILAENPEASDALRDELDPILDEIRRR